MSERTIVIPSLGMSMAAAAARLAAAGHLMDLTLPRRELPNMPYMGMMGATRKQRRQADRSKKQYLLKGIRP